MWPGPLALYPLDFYSEQLYDLDRDHYVNMVINEGSPMAAEFEVTISVKTNVPVPKDQPTFTGLDAINQAMELGGLARLVADGEYELRDVQVTRLAVEDYEEGNGSGEDEEQDREDEDEEQEQEQEQEDTDEDDEQEQTEENTQTINEETSSVQDSVGSITLTRRN